MTNRETVMLEYLSAAYASGEENVRLLYKYRPCKPHHIECLRNDTLWFSTADQLNDPFDCQIRLPKTANQHDLNEIRRHLAHAEPFQVSVDSSRASPENIGGASELPALVPLGLMAAQLSHHRLLRHIAKIEHDNDRWLLDLFEMAREVADTLLHNVTVFCLCEPKDHQLMWAHYAASHTGFCTGYVSPVGIGNPRLIHKVSYVDSLPRISPWNVIDDPGQVHADLTLTKSSAWAYEKEWRVTFGNMPGLLGSLLPYKEVILGAKISPEHESQIREAIDSRDTSLYRAIIDPSADRFEVRVQPA